MEIIKVNDTPVTTQMRGNHIPSPGDIYIYGYNYSFYKVVSKDGKYNIYTCMKWSFEQNSWVSCDEKHSFDSHYYKLLLHPFEEVLELCNKVYDNPESLMEMQLENQDCTSLITQGDKLGVMLEQSQLMEDRLESIQALMRSKVEEIKEKMLSKVRALDPVLGSLRKTMRDIQEVINILNAYVGDGVEVKQITEGEPASIDTPISIRQRILFMDEEVAIIGKDGQGLDYSGKDTFYEWLKDSGNRNIVLPEVKCVVVFKPKRFQHRYTRDSYTNNLLNQWNKHSFILIRNGDNVYSIESENLNIYDAVIPTKQTLDRILNADDYFSKKYQQEEMDSLKYRGLFFCMIIQGLVDRSTVFHPVKPNINIVKNIGVDLIYDGEDSIGTGIDDFKTWLKKRSENIKRGSRIIYVNGGKNLKYYSNDYSMPNPPKQGLYSVDEYDGKLVFKYSPGDTYWGWNGPHDRQNRVSWVFEKHNAINYDEIDLDELEMYLKDRTQRLYYVDILPLLLHCRREKLKEKQWENAFKESMIKYFSDKYNVALQPELLNEAVKWWKMKVIFKRPLKQDDAKSWRMIEKYCLNKLI